MLSLLTPDNWHCKAATLAPDKGYGRPRLKDVVSRRCKLQIKALLWWKLDCSPIFAGTANFNRKQACNAKGCKSFGYFRDELNGSTSSCDIHSPPQIKVLIIWQPSDSNVEKQIPQTYNSVHNLAKEWNGTGIFVAVLCTARMLWTKVKIPSHLWLLCLYLWRVGGCFSLAFTPANWLQPEQ